MTRSQTPAAAGAEDFGAARTLVFDHAFLPDGWARDVRVTVQGGVISNVAPDAAGTGGERVKGIAIPGLPNLHCHTFQRGMAGLAERRGPSDDSFWTWRDVMYRFLGRLTPEDVEAIAAYAYAEMQERGFTAVGEFHYIHHGADGTPYADLAEMAARIVAAASGTGIGLTLLPAFYAYGGFGAAPAVPGQRRFLNDPDRFLKLVEATRAAAARLPSTAVGIAPHSLRAVTPETLAEVVKATPQGPIHIHIAEQVKEVEDCLAWSGARPVAWLYDHMPVDARWCLIHATHMTGDETRRLAASGAVAGLCPITEASLGDGIFNGPDYLAAGGRLGVGSDSNIEIDAAGELRLLEYSQRLGRRGRNLMTTEAGESTGHRLFTAALAGGAQALGRPIGALAAGQRADIVVLDSEHTSFSTVAREHWLDSWIFVPGRPAVDSVFTGGVKVVEGGRHLQRDAIAARYRVTLEKLLGRLLDA
ncbi:N-formimino-L-glutamate deiminase [Bradyrhizobium sp. NAS80.1]|uniref:formimidoylglutamate deiminase n=1 Tax=Bradyrhizobium sp. NAS80.1 TaxID=1680159 RepID=UPI00095E7802|nr:formimidoylglutamate deiminase [Bradyrhizobium sp. NAS80.1]OKO86789.1 N-formimino-L-glutamate deiminase [Bradyrhizobium sp. NAS80.1]